MLSSLAGTGEESDIGEEEGGGFVSIVKSVKLKITRERKKTRRKGWDRS